MSNIIYRQNFFLAFASTVLILACISLLAELLPEVHAKPIVMTTLILTIGVTILGIIRR